MKTQRQKRVIGLISALVLSLAMLAGSIPSALAAENDRLTLTAQIQLQSDDPGDSLPESVTVRLLADGEEIASTQATVNTGYQVEFDVPLPETAAPTYSIQIDLPENYSEDSSLHIDPVLNFICPAGNDWTKYEPCNELMIPTERLSREVIGAKMTKHGPMIIWTPEPMTAAEKLMIVNSMMKNPGVGNPSSVVFVVGNAVTEYGLTINADEGKVLMDRPSDWSLIFGGEYTKSGMEILNGQIVLNPVKTPITDPPIIDEPLDPPTDDPTTPGEDVPEQIPDVKPDDPIIDTPPTDEPDDPAIDNPEQNPDVDPNQPAIDDPSVDNPPLDGPDDPTVDVPEQIPDVKPDDPIIDTPPTDDPEQNPDIDPDLPAIDDPSIDNPPLDAPDNPTVDVPEQIPDVKPDDPIIDTPPTDDPKDPVIDIPEQNPNVKPNQPTADTLPQDENIIIGTQTIPEKAAQNEKTVKDIPNTGIETDIGVIAAAVILIMAAAGLSIVLSERKKKN